MNCAYHPEIQADAYCRTCGKPLCTACKRDVKGVIYCEDCIAARVVDTMPPAMPAPASGGKVPGAPTPAVATLLGFIPGVGQMYNGQFAKSFALIFAFALLIWAETLDISDGAHALLGFAIFAVYAFMVFDAYKTARAKELGEPLPDPFGLNSLFGESSAPARPVAAAAVPRTVPAAGAAFIPGDPNAPPPYVPAPEGRRSAGPAGAFLLIGVGVLFLLGNLDIVRFNLFDRLWPVIIIAVGVWMFWRRRPECQCQRCQTSCLMGPAMVVTVGVLLLLAVNTRFGFHYTWPIFLLVLGGVKLLQANASTEGHVNIAPTLPSPALTPTSPQAPSSTNSEVTNA